MAIADGVVLVGAVAGVDTAVGGDDLAEGVVAPEPAWGCWVGGAAGGDSGALADGIHGVVVFGDDGDGKFVCLGVKDVAGGLPFVDDGVDGADDFFDEVAVREVLVGEGLVWDLGFGDWRFGRCGRQWRSRHTRLVLRRWWRRVCSPR